MVTRLQVSGLLHNQYKCQVGARRWLWLRCAGALGVGCHIFATFSTFQDQVPSMGGQWHSGPPAAWQPRPGAWLVTSYFMGRKVYSYNSRYLH